MHCDPQSTSARLGHNPDGRQLTSEDWAALSRLAAELAELPLGETTAAMRHALLRLTAHLGGRSASAVLLSKSATGGAVRHRPGINDGWRPVLVLNVGPDEAESDRLVEEFLRERRYPDDPAVQAAMREAGVRRAFLLGDLVEAARYEESPLGMVHRALGIGDRVVGFLPVRVGVEVAITVDRVLAAAPFEAHARDVMCFGLHMLSPLLERFARSTGVIDASEPLTPRERDVLRLLLTGKVESEIAKELGMGQRSLHQRVVTIYRKFGVASRPQLMALWLNAHKRELAPA